ncbi:hypothetical protein E4N62_09725 [Streptomyces sp. MNU76]|uniref:hypothetical protein n=1 Tax=Streptomyces sp. MNU76 TaxID=2560026 RepID=UPI001E63C5A0|nr:hypothetical protein [Streptomyces sp. MNU76]MCC9705519.1 hypothetical protein [Streptomyces sp. MNU76]
MADEGSTHPLPAAFYDVHEGDRFDLDPYIAVAAGLNARTVVAIGCDIGVGPEARRPRPVRRRPRPDQVPST